MSALRHALTAISASAEWMGMWSKTLMMAEATCATLR